MKLLIDECLPLTLKRHLVGHECHTVQEMGWSGKKNDVLLSLAEPEFDILILVTIDQGMEYQQNLGNRKIAPLMLGARSNQIEDLAPLLPKALAALRSIQPGFGLENK